MKGHLEVLLLCSGGSTKAETVLVWDLFFSLPQVLGGEEDYFSVTSCHPLPWERAAVCKAVTFLIVLWHFSTRVAHSPALICTYGIISHHCPDHKQKVVGTASGRAVLLSSAFALQPHFPLLLSHYTRMSRLPALHTALFYIFISWIYFFQHLLNSAFQNTERRCNPALV